jgi:hypothetical protein
MVAGGAGSPKDLTHSIKPLYDKLVDYLQPVSGIERDLSR